MAKIIVSVESQPSAAVPENELEEYLKARLAEKLGYAALEHSDLHIENVVIDGAKTSTIRMTAVAYVFSKTELNALICRVQHEKEKQIFSRYHAEVEV